MNCPKCKAGIDADSFYCDQCGLELRFCQSCHRPGKGNRCTACGGRMLSRSAFPTGGSLPTPQASPSPTPLRTSTFNPSNSDATVKAVSVANPSSPRLFLSNAMLGMSFEGVDGAVIGRRQGIYQNLFSGCPYVSGSHARLQFDAALQQWMIVDLNSSNGTRYNGTSLTGGIPCALSHGSVIQLANIPLTVSIN